LTVAVVTVTLAQPAPAPDAAQLQASIGSLAALQHGPRVPPVLRPLPKGETRSLRALIINVERRVDWRSSEEAPWRDAKVNDVLEAGAEIRTGTRSSATLRVGRNATIFVDRSTYLALPEILLAGDTLRTRAGLRRGRANFKVDPVEPIGLTNDFEVLTPTTTLAVRGTGFGVKWGGLDGVDVDVLRSQKIHAIELQYLATQMAYLMTVGAVSRENHPNPVVAALFDSVKPPPIWGSTGTGETSVELAEEAFVKDRELNAGRRVEYGILGTEQTEEFVSELSSEVQFICNNFNEFFGAYRGALEQTLGLDTFAQQGLYLNLTIDVRAFCDNLRGFQGDPLQHIQDQVDAFCGQAYQRPSDIERCKSLFHGLLKGIE
jgi:hypothetical protein